MNANFFGKLRKEGDTLVYVNPKDADLYKEFKNNLPEGAIIEMYAEVVHDDANLAQLAKVHAMIRELSNFTGDTPANMKLVVKEKAGLCLLRTLEGKEYFLCKSFGDASKEELSSAIQTCIEIGEEIGHPIQ